MKDEAMTVEQLIELLTGVDPNLPVESYSYEDCGDGHTFSPVDVKVEKGRVILSSPGELEYYRWSFNE